uniref:Uncharacterized protein n=1 Tax=Rhizophora mucronata TaxID=61149 RepID=A0A2P2QIM7_RHIMU
MLWETTYRRFFFAKYVIGECIYCSPLYGRN